MPNSILIPVALDQDTLVPGKLATARTMLEPGGQITLLCVLESVPGYASEFVTVKSENHLTDKVSAQLDALKDGNDVHIMVTSGKPGIRIAEVAEEIGADLVIVGARQPGALDIFLGSTAARVARRAPCSVLIQR
ncbi:MAG: universal stress protein [Pseudomonadota bacterium]